jgi:hypothetical protein
MKLAHNRVQRQDLALVAPSSSATKVIYEMIFGKYFVRREGGSQDCV